MKNRKCLGIWMDYSNAYLMELKYGEINTTIIKSSFTQDKKKEILLKGEKAMHHKKQQLTLDYFNAIASVIKNYEEVILFGPTDAKIELLKMLKSNHQYDDKHIDALTTDKMTEKQLHAFVKKYFLKNLSLVF